MLKQMSTHISCGSDVCGFFYLFFLFYNLQLPKRHATIYKTLHRKLKIEHHQSQKKQGVNSGAPPG
jgi:hypothetical protein